MLIDSHISNTIENTVDDFKLLDHEQALDDKCLNMNFLKFHIYSIAWLGNG